MSQSKNGVAAKELERQLGVTYKCAWRMARQIRLLMTDDDGPLGDNEIVELDETYVGGKTKAALPMNKLAYCFYLRLKRASMKIFK